MRSTIILSALLALALGGCLEPKSHQALDRDGDAAVVPGGPWGECFDAMAAGRTGDSCTFPGGCGSPDTNDHWNPAYCLGGFEGSGVLLRYELDTSLDPTSPGECLVDRGTAPAADGCVTIQNCDLVHTYCQPDAMLPPATDDIPVVLESEADCEALLADEIIAPGRACTGTQICGLHLPIGASGTHEPMLVWCHAERLRAAAPLEIFF